MRAWTAFACVVALGLLLSGWAPSSSREERLAQYRNLGKAFYENPTTQKEAVLQFRRVLALEPQSDVAKLNLGLALLRAGATAEATRLLESVQKSKPDLPHTYFNLGILAKKAGDSERAIQQFEQMVRLVPTEPISRYNLGSLYRSVDKAAAAIEQLKAAASLQPGLAAAHFQLYNIYRTTGRAEAAQAELAIFQQLKKQQEGAAIPEDVEWSDFAEVYDPPTSRIQEAPRPPLRFRTTPAGYADGAAMVSASELLTWSGTGGLRLQTKPILPDLKGIRSVRVADYDNDGVLDALALTVGEAVLLHRNGAAFSIEKRWPGAYNAAVWLDYDHDYDSDIFLLGAQSKLLRNIGKDWEERTSIFPFVAREAIDGAAFRLLPDSKSFDLLVSYGAGGGVLYRDRLQGTYEAEPAPIPDGATRLQVADMDNDGALDAVYSHGGAVARLRNTAGTLQPGPASNSSGPFVLADVHNRGALDVITQKEILPACMPIGAADLNADGRIDVICQSAIATNVTLLRTSFLNVRLTGVKNQKVAPGAEVEVKAGRYYQKQVYQGLPLHFGTGTRVGIDTIRITWPNGLIQNEVRQFPGKTLRFEEAQRLSGSCPIVWSWNGRAFEYITDVLGVAPLGASSGDGTYFPVDHDEYIQIPGASLRPRDGNYEIRLTEELSEVAYFDHVQLIALDHPEWTTIVTNEKWKGPPFPEFRLFGIDKPLRPVAATDNRGGDVRSQLVAKDRRYPATFLRDASGVAEQHSLTLDFGSKAAKTNESTLVLSGWVDWADGSTFLATAQGGAGLQPPYLQVRDASGQWRTVMEDMGMPAGKPKTIAIDLSGKFLSASRQIRIVTNLCVYWDEIYLSESAAPPVSKLTALPNAAAELQFRGFSPSIIHPQRKQPEQFRYDGPSSTSYWNPTPGRYTRYGDVAELTSSVDDKLVVMGSGDELRLRFSAKGLPSIPQGWTRDFLLLVDGWAKDRDANTAQSQTTEPLPFHAMSQFPFPTGEHYPDTPGHRLYRETYNTRPALRLLRPLSPSSSLPLLNKPY